MRIITSVVLAILASIGCAQFKVDPQMTPVVPTNRHALIIGASDYQHLGKLSYAASDAKRFKDAMVTGFKLEERSIKFLSDDSDGTRKPTSENIRKALKELLADPRLNRGDLFILYFSGHGIGTRSGDYLCATDSTVADVEETGVPLRGVIQDLSDANLRNVVIITDACRAGEKNSFGIDLADKAKKANIAVMLGCQPGTKSYESPSLRSGVFTYFLLKALGNPKNRTASGGLWASKISQSLENAVFEYTQHDYGDNAQRPYSFADPTSDVMLAKYIDKMGASVKDQDLDVASDPTKNSYELMVTAEAMLANSDFAGALESAKLALSLDSTNLDSAYFAAIAASMLGRSGEHQKFCDQMIRSNNLYYKNFGVVISDSRATPVEVRIKAMEAYWQASAKDEMAAIQIWTRARTYASMAETKRVILMILPALPITGRLRLFFEGELANADGKLDLAIEKYRAARKAVGTTVISNDLLVVLEMSCQFTLHKYDDLKSLLKEQFDTDKVSPLIWSSGAAYLKLIGNRDAAVAIIKKGLKEGALPEDDVVLVAVAMGTKLPEIVDDLEAQVKSQPFNWKLRTVAIFARGMISGDANATATAFEEARRYCDDDLEIAALAYKINSAILDDALAQGQKTKMTKGEILESYRLLFLTYIDHIGTDSDKWQILGMTGISSAQGPNTYRIFKKYIKDFNARSTQGPEFYSVLFQLAASDEDDDMAKFAALHPTILEPDRSDSCLNYVAYLLTKRDYVAARTAMTQVKQVSPEAAPLKSAADAILLARAGDKSALLNFLKNDFTAIEASQAARGIAAICLADLGLGELALPHLKAVSEFNIQIVPNIRFRCIEAAIGILKASGKSAEADDVLFDMLNSDQVCPAVRKCFFGSKPLVGNFVGEFKSDTQWVTDDMFERNNPTHKTEFNLAAMGEGSIAVKVNADGIVKGTVTITGGETYEIMGKVDANGNLQGEAKGNKNTLIVEAKMLSNDFKQTDTFKKSNVGQIIVFTDERGIQTRWLIPFSRMKS